MKSALAVRLACMSITTGRLRGAVMDPHHEHPVGGQNPDVEETRRQEQRQGERSGGIAASPEGRQEVPDTPEEAQDEPRGQGAVAPSQLGCGKSRPAELFQ